MNKETTSGALRPNTELCVDLKTLLWHDAVARLDRYYRGTLTNDDGEHFTFVESLPRHHRYSPQVYNGKFITIARGSDNTLRPHLKRIRLGYDTAIEQFATGVACELILAYKCLREEKLSEAQYDPETIGW